MKTSKGASVNACQLSEYNADVVAVIVKLIALDLAAIFRCTVISSKGLTGTDGNSLDQP